MRQIGFQIYICNMIHDLELLNQDYEVFITHCSKCSSSEAIKRFVDNQFRKYYSSNPNMLIDFMSQIERCFPNVEYDLDEDKPLGSEDVWSFRLEFNDIDDIQIQWLYSYICLLNESGKSSQIDPLIPA